MWTPSESDPWGSLTNDTYTTDSSFTWAAFFLFWYAATISRKVIKQDYKRNVSKRIVSQHKRTDNYLELDLGPVDDLAMVEDTIVLDVKKSPKVGIYTRWETTIWGTNVFEWTWIIRQPREEVNENRLSSQISRHSQPAQTPKHEQ